jgi:calcineurin-like phosphoesterase family protein
LEPFVFALVADSHVRLEEGRDGYDFYPSNRFTNGRSRFAVSRLNQVGPDFVVHLGDVVYPIPALDSHETAVRTAFDLYGDLDCRLFVVPGNHDVGDKPNSRVPAPGVSESSHVVFEKYWGRAFQSFDHGGAHFVLVNSPVLNSGLEMEREQERWLEEDLRLNRESGRRVFLFTHYPLYLENPGESEHYDNVAGPARSWLLSLLEEFRVEAVFSAHSHCFFYNRHNETDLYVAPSLSFFRPDFSELFKVGPDSEYGRNDVNKLGFLLVMVDASGHAIKYVRTMGLAVESMGETPSNPLGVNSFDSSCPLGVFMRHSWATPLEIPYDNLDEYNRKFARNDYPLLALMDLGIRKVRLPLKDLEEGGVRDRMMALKTLGFRFTFFTSGIPGRDMEQTINKNKDIIDVLELIVTRDRMAAGMLGLQGLKRETGIKLHLSKMHSIADQLDGEELHFSHFPSHGFQLTDRGLISQLVNEGDEKNPVDGIVFRIPPGSNLSEGITEAKRFANELKLEAVAHVQLPRKSEGEMPENEGEISNLLAETLTIASTKVNIFLDTFIDHDRGYYPRRGIIDRRGNPNPGYHVLKTLQQPRRTC